MTGWGGDAERRYTLDEAKTEIARQECAVHGHSFDVVQTDAGPVEILCSNGCGASWQVAGVPDLDDTKQAVDAQPVLDFHFRGYPGTLTVKAVLTDTRGRERLFEVPVHVEHSPLGNESVMTLDLEAWTGYVCRAIDEGTFGP